MPGRSKTLSVDFFTQPTDNTCQSTCLKMMASYLEGGDGLNPGPATELNPVDVYQSVNNDPGRPDKVNTNSHKNMMWWLKNRFPTLNFKEIITRDDTQATEVIVNSIDRNSPVMVGVSHARVPGHIILVIGYVNYRPFQCSADFGVVVHDPYGKFDPSLSSKLYGARRFDGGACMVGGGEAGPGKSVVLPILGVSRQRAGDASRGAWFLIFVDR
jgi:hypothetical protein